MRETCGKNPEKTRCVTICSWYTGTIKSLSPFVPFCSGNNVFHLYHLYHYAQMVQVEHVLSHIVLFIAVKNCAFPGPIKSFTWAAWRYRGKQPLRLLAIQACPVFCVTGWCFWRNGTSPETKWNTFCRQKVLRCNSLQNLFHLYHLYPPFRGTIGGSGFVPNLFHFVFCSRNCSQIVLRKIKNKSILCIFSPRFYVGVF